MNRIASLVYRSFLVSISFIGIFLSSRILEGTFNTDLFVYYTHISNILCFVVMLIVLIYNYKKVINKEVEGHNEVIIKLKAASTMAIFVTGVVYHFLLGDPSVDGFFSIDNLIVHYVVPIMFVLDWILFDKKRNITVLQPLTWTAIPLVYLVYALIRGAIVGPGDDHIHYAYFFIDVTIYGYGGVALWALGLTAVFVLVGYFFWFMDKLTKVDGKLTIKIKED